MGEALSDALSVKYVAAPAGNLLSLLVGGMMNRKRVTAIAGLVVLTICGFISLYQALFDLWMTAYPLAHVSFWRTRLYLHLAMFITVGAP